MRDKFIFIKYFHLRDKLIKFKFYKIYKIL